MRTYEKNQKEAVTKVLRSAHTQDVPLDRGAIGPGDDVVFDFSDQKSTDLGGLSLLLTAQQLAAAANRRVWIKDLPYHTWQILISMGLSELFLRFPQAHGPMD